jgi:hypothetical protein
MFVADGTLADRLACLRLIQITVHTHSPFCMFGSPLNSGLWQPRPIQLPKIGTMGSHRVFREQLLEAWQCFKRVKRQIIDLTCVARATASHNRPPTCFVLNLK